MLKINKLYKLFMLQSGAINRGLLNISRLYNRSDFFISLLRTDLNKQLDKQLDLADSFILELEKYKGRLQHEKKELQKEILKQKLKTSING